MKHPLEYPVIADFVDGLEAGGMWDEYCAECERKTPHPDGKCRVCGTDPDEDED